MIYIHFHNFPEQWPKHLGYQSLVGGPDILKPEWHYIVAVEPVGGGGGGGGGVIKDVFSTPGGYMGI